MDKSSVVFLDRGSETTCTVNLHGATVVSWRVKNQEQLFVSKLAVFDGKKPIRGGVPIVFPRFGAWSFGPHHGFAQIVRWTLDKPPQVLANGNVEAILSLKDSDYTLSMWSFPFELTYKLTLHEKELHFNITVNNPSQDWTFSFNLLLHTYFKVTDLQKCQITGLQGCTYLDKTLEGALCQETRDMVTINGCTDRIYIDANNELLIVNAVSGRKIHIEKYNFPDSVVWNPWIDKAMEMKDFDDDEYQKMVCVASGHVSSPVSLLPGTTFEARQILKVI